MPLPTLEKAWNFVVNNVVPAGTNQQDSGEDLFAAIKAALIAAGWTVKGSSNGTTAAMDAVDRVTVGTKPWDWQGGTINPHSWVVMKIPVGFIPTGQAEVLFDIGPNETFPGRNMSTTVSLSAGFVLAGTPTHSPTATDGFFCGNGLLGPQNPGSPGPAYQTAWHLMYTTDLKHWRIVMHFGGVQTTMVLFENVLSPVSGWTTEPPVLATWTSSGIISTVNVYATFNDVSTYVTSRINGTNVEFFFTTEGYGSAMIGEQHGQNQVSLEYPLTPIGLASATATRTGRHGRLPDIWWASTNGSLVEGSTYPAAGSRLFVQFGKMVFPWNGSIPVIT